MANKKVLLTRYGGPEVLQIVDDPILPEPAAGEVRIKVEASSAVYTDTLIRRGLYPSISKKPPFTLGYDVVGRVDKLGAGVTQFKIGQRVADLTQIGSNAEYTVRPAAGLVSVPESLDAAEAVSMVLSYQTAYQMLKRVAQVKAGDKILIHGAGGGAVGTALLQLGKNLGLEMVATTSAGKLEVVRQYGATALDYNAPDYKQALKQAAGRGFDSIYDAVGYQSFPRLLGLLKRGGVLVNYGVVGPARGVEKQSVFLKLFAPVMLFGLNYGFKVWNVLPTNRQGYFYDITEYKIEHPDHWAEDLGELFDLLGEGKLQPVIQERLRLDEAARAHTLIDQEKVRGRLVYVM